MTNENKIFELSLKYFPYVNPTIDSPIKQALQEMAAWKQEKMIEKAVEFIKQHNGSYFRAWLDDSGDYYRGELDDRFYEDFKKTMMEE